VAAGALVSQDLQLQQRCCLLESPGEAGEDERLIGAQVQFMGCCQLHAVVATQGKGISKASGRFNKLLADLHNRAERPAPDQLLTGLLKYIGVIGFFLLTAGHAMPAMASTQVMRHTAMAYSFMAAVEPMARKALELSKKDDP
jgi:hypothetical protein